LGKATAPFCNILLPCLDGSCCFFLLCNFSVMCLSLCVLWYNIDQEVCFAIFAESELMRIEMLQRIEERHKKSPPVVMQDAPRREIPSPPAVVELPPQASSLPSPPPPPETETMKKPSSILSKPLADVGGEDTVLQHDIAKQSNS